MITITTNEPTIINANDVGDNSRAESSLVIMIEMFSDDLIKYSNIFLPVELETIRIKTLPFE